MESALLTIPEGQKHKNCKPIQGVLNENGCLICTSHKTNDGEYPNVRRDGRLWDMHRYMFYKWNEEIPEGELIRHTCNNTHCINPEHLRRGTYQDNSDDMTRSDRQAQGSLCTSAKLHEGIVNYIRFFAEDSAKKLAEQFNVSIPTIYNIKNNKTWKHVHERYFYDRVA
ncbi:MAG: HNH endonuclease [Ignavibacteriae bacterium]|nr:HNH endonuclease [Ignavibacteriota bacterium]